MLTPNEDGANSQVVPEWRAALLSERDQELNKLSTTTLIELLNNHKIGIFVDRGLALNAARSGIPVSFIATILALLFPSLIICSITLLIFVSWKVAFFAILGAIVAFKSSRHFTKQDVGVAAVRDPNLLKLLMQKGVVWFSCD